MQREYVILVRKSVQQVMADIASLPRMASGRVSAAQPIARIILIRMGLAALERIHRQFVVKSRGGTDDTGLRWQRITPYTIAHRENKNPDILKNKGDLERSLKPALPPNAARLDAPSVKYQVFRIGQRQVIVGTRRPFAGTHHRGLLRRVPPVPQRRLWPELNRWTPRWWQGMLRQAQRGVIALLVWALRRKP